MISVLVLICRRPEHLSRVFGQDLFNHPAQGLAVGDEQGVSDRQALFRVVEAILAEDPAQVLRLTGDLYQYGYDPRRLCHDLLTHFHDLVVAKVSSDVSVLADLPDHEVEIVRKQAALRSREDLQRFFASLLETEEAVRKSAYTQLVIEMALVKLASQPPVLPIQEALTKLEELQNQFGSSSSRPASTRQPRFRPSGSVESIESIGSVGSSGLKDPKDSTDSKDPKDSTDSKDSKDPKDPTASSTVEHLEQGEQWDGFLTMIRSRKISLFFALKAGYLLNVTPTVLQIGVDKDPYLKELSRQENRTILEESAEQFFGRKLTIEVQKGKHELAVKQSISPPGEGARVPKSAQDPADPADPLVRTALDILGGEIQERRTPRASGTG